MFVLIGWAIAMACIFGVYIVHGGNIGVILKALPFEMITIFGAAFGAFLVNNQMKVVKASIAGLGQCFKGSKHNKARYMELMALLYDILQKARKEGLMSIEKDVEDPHSSPLFQKYPNVGNDHHVTEFITDYLRMMVSGNLNPHEIEALMDSEIETHHQEAHAPVAAIARLAGGLPAFGIVAAVLGVVNNHGLCGAATGRAGRDDRIGTGGHLPRHLAGLRLRGAPGRTARAKARGKCQGAAMRQDDVAGEHAGLRSADRRGIRTQGAVLARPADLLRTRSPRQGQEVIGVRHGS